MAKIDWIVTKRYSCKRLRKIHPYTIIPTFSSIGQKLPKLCVTLSLKADNGHVVSFCYRNKVTTYFKSLLEKRFELALILTYLLNEPGPLVSPIIFWTTFRSYFHMHPRTSLRGCVHPLVRSLVCLSVLPLVYPLIQNAFVEKSKTRFTMQ